MFKILKRSFANEAPCPSVEGGGCQRPPGESQRAQASLRGLPYWAAPMSLLGEQNGQVP